MNYVIFGAGQYGAMVVDLIGRDRICFFIDNDIKKQESGYLGFDVLSLENSKGLLCNKQIVIATSTNYEKQIIEQLRQNGIGDVLSFDDLKLSLFKEKQEQTTDFISIYKKCIDWIKKHSIEDGGVIVNSTEPYIYPEVTGYYIPSLIRWGYRDLAIMYGKKLLKLQREDGAWNGVDGKNAYVFDTAQVLKGLNAIRAFLPEAEMAAIKGADWIVASINDDGKLCTPTEGSWGDSDTCTDLVHLYCLSPLVEISKYTGDTKYQVAANKVLEYYLNNFYDKIMNFCHLSHFHAYLMEGLLDMHKDDIVKKAMSNILLYLNDDGVVPAYNNCSWICSTGLFQLSLVWYRLGDIPNGDRAFYYACKLQNDSGGWFGSYLSGSNNKENNTYFPNSEISWANKYFLDALYWKNKAEFDDMSGIFLAQINKEDGRYEIIKRVAKEIVSNKNQDEPIILDVGCGKGRYIRNLISDKIKAKMIGVDISHKVLEYIDEDIEMHEGTLTNIPLPDHSVDYVYACESMEHAIDIESAIKEMSRVTKSKGTMVIIDKNKEKLGRIDITDFEQWLDIEEFEKLMLKYCEKVKVETNVKYENNKEDGLFCAWIGKLK